MWYKIVAGLSVNFLSHSLPDQTLLMLWFLNQGSHRVEYIIGQNFPAWRSIWFPVITCIKGKFHYSITDCTSSTNSWMHKLKRAGLKLQPSLTPYSCVNEFVLLLPNLLSFSLPSFHLSSMLFSPLYLSPEKEGSCALSDRDRALSRTS